MANTFSQIYFHIVFSTKNRVDLIHPDIEARVWTYIGGVARKHRTSTATDLPLLPILGKEI